MMTIIVVRLVPGFMRHDDLELWLINSNTNSIMAPRLTLAMPSQCNKFIICMSWVISRNAIHKWAEKVDLVALTFELLICLLSFMCFILLLFFHMAFRSKVTAIFPQSLKMVYGLLFVSYEICIISMVLCDIDLKSGLRVALDVDS